MDYVVFDMNWFDIPIQDYPVDNLVVCHDPKNRLGTPTWGVVFVPCNASPLELLGLFWDKKWAIKFAKSFKTESKVEKLKEEKEFFEYQIMGIMHSVDKWFEDDDPRLKDNPESRAAESREIVLKVIEKLQEENIQLKKKLDEEKAFYESLSEMHDALIEEYNKLKK